MLRQGLTRTLALCAIILCILSSCSIYDDYGYRRQRDIILQVADDSGNILPDSKAPVNEVYAFVNGIYVGKYAKEEDGKIRIVVDEADSVTFVAVTGEHRDEYTIKEPQVGESISNTWLQLIDAEKGNAISPSAIYYGSLSSPFSDKLEEETVITLKDVRAKTSVYLKGLKACYGDGNYRVVLEGMNSGVTYDGNGGGKLVNYEMGGKFNAKGDWFTPAMIVLPTTGEAVKVKIYKEDGTLLYTCDHTDDGSPLAVKPGDNVVFYITIWQNADISIKVIPFDDVDNPIFFQ